jgi:general secretion pathway protein B
MSYILDALKKSEAERARGAVPGLHTQTDSAPQAVGGSTVSGKVVVWIALAVMVIAISTAAFAWLGKPRAPAMPDQGELAPVTQPTPASQIVAQAPQVKPIAPIAPPVVIVTPPAASSAPTAPPPPAATPEIQKTAPADLAKPKIEEKKPEAKIAETSTPKPAAAPDPLPVRKTEPVEVAVPPENRVGSLRDLPPNLQKDIPPIAFSGYIYSSNPADRSVLIGNRLLREGDQVAPGLTLERLLQKDAILNYMGHRFRVAY